MFDLQKLIVHYVVVSRVISITKRMVGAPSYNLHATDAVGFFFHFYFLSSASLSLSLPPRLLPSYLLLYPLLFTSSLSVLFYCAVKHFSQQCNRLIHNSCRIILRQTRKLLFCLASFLPLKTKYCRSIYLYPHPS